MAIPRLGHHGVVALGGVIGLGLFTRRFMRSVADFLAAGRSAGRYLITISYGVANIGAITVLAFFEQNYEAGATLMWWEALLQMALLVAMLTGWVIYRFRRTRCLTLAEFFERRYGRGFRVFAGGMAFVAGVLNFAIFPLVGSKFFVFFCGLPPEIALFGAVMPTHVPLMVFLLGIAIWFVFTGGQVSVLATDFAQGVFANMVFVVISVFLLVAVGWGDISERPAAGRTGPLAHQPLRHGGDPALRNPVLRDQPHRGALRPDELAGRAGLLHARRAPPTRRAWAASCACGSCRSGWCSSWWCPSSRSRSCTADAWVPVQEPADAALAGLDDPHDVGRLRVPVVLSLVLPAGLKGLMAAMMLAAFISTHNTYLHSWGSIFTQDVVLPVLGCARRAARAQRAHIWLLRLAIVGVAVFAFCYSAFFYDPTQPIMLYLAITGAIFLGWSGHGDHRRPLLEPRHARARPGPRRWSARRSRLASFLLQRMNDAFAQSDGRAPSSAGSTGWGRRRAGAAGPSPTHMPDGKEILGLTMAALRACTYVIVSLLERRRFDHGRAAAPRTHAIAGEVEYTGGRVSGWAACWPSRRSTHARDRSPRCSRRASSGSGS